MVVVVVGGAVVDVGGANVVGAGRAGTVDGVVEVVVLLVGPLRVVEVPGSVVVVGRWTSVVVVDPGVVEVVGADVVVVVGSVVVVDGAGSGGTARHSGRRSGRAAGNPAGETGAGAGRTSGRTSGRKDAGRKATPPETFRKARRLGADSFRKGFGRAEPSRRLSRQVYARQHFRKEGATVPDHAQHRGHVFSRPGRRDHRRQREKGPPTGGGRKAARAADP